MSKKRSAKDISERELTGLKYFRKLLPLLERLRPVGCQRDKAGNRQLFFDHYCALILLYLFNPILTSLRSLQQASELKNVQRKLGCPRAALGSLSEAARVFDPQLLEELVAELLERLPTPPPEDQRLQDLRKTLTAVDGTLLKTLPQITQACYGTRRDQGWRLHTHFEILKGVPVRIALTDASNSQAANEKAVLRTMLQADRCYILDRGYEEFALFNAIRAAGSSYVCRIRADHHFTAEAPRALSPAARQAGVLEDAVGRLGSPKSKRIEHPDHRVRRITVHVEPHPKRGGRRRQGATQELVIVTDLLDVPAEVLVLLYRHRWLIELFFRTLKHLLGCRHLLSQHPQGITIQAYCAIIACLLIALVTGRRPTKRTYEMLCFYFLGWAEEDELVAHLERLKEQDRKA